MAKAISGHSAPKCTMAIAVLVATRQSRDPCLNFATHALPSSATTEDFKLKHRKMTMANGDGKQ